MKIILPLILFIFVYSPSLFGQTTNPTPVPQQTTREMVRENQRRQAESENRKKEFERLRDGNSQNIDNDFIERESFPFKAPVNKDQRRRLKPDEQLAAKYSAFLKQPRTGLIKLFPDIGCEKNLLVLRADAGCLNWIPNSAFYSFREKEHTSDFLADISFQDNAFITNGILSQGILTALGNISLETVSLSTDGMRFLTDYKPALQNREILSQFQEIRNIVKSGNYVYAKALPALEDTTYAARIIAYKGKYLSAFQGRLYDVLEGDKRLDMIVVFRIVGANEDGSISVLWKELSRKEAPTAIFPKKSKKQEK